MSSSAPFVSNSERFNQAICNLFFRTFNRQDVNDEIIQRLVVGNIITWKWFSFVLDGIKYFNL